MYCQGFSMCPSYVGNNPINDLFPVDALVLTTQMDKADYINGKGLWISGKNNMLTRMISKAIAMREMACSFYVTPVNKCFLPYDQEYFSNMYICTAKYLYRELIKTKPKLIIASGEAPARVMLSHFFGYNNSLFPSTEFTKYRGMYFDLEFYDKFKTNLYITYDIADKTFLFDDMTTVSDRVWYDINFSLDNTMFTIDNSLPERPITDTFEEEEPTNANTERNSTVVFGHDVTVLPVNTNNSAGR